MGKVIKAAFLAVLALTFLGPALADDDDRGHKRRRQREHRSLEQKTVEPVTNETYRRVCGECHFVYQPALLPSSAWLKILSKPDEHFGEQIDLSDQDKDVIRGYLETCAAEHSRAECAERIIRCLKGRIPDRITEIPYIRREHEDDDLPPGGFQRKSVGSFSNCVACHQTAEKGIYDEHQVRIPD